MPESEQVARGLNGRTEDQRTALAVLLTGYYFAGLSDAVQQSSVRGSFEGWDGDTTLELLDGTVSDSRSITMSTTTPIAQMSPYSSSPSVMNYWSRTPTNPLK